MSAVGAAVGLLLARRGLPPLAYMLSADAPRCFARYERDMVQRAHACGTAGFQVAVLLKLAQTDKPAVTFLQLGCLPLPALLMRSQASRLSSKERQGTFAGATAEPTAADPYMGLPASATNAQVAVRALSFPGEQVSNECLKGLIQALQAAEQGVPYKLAAVDEIYDLLGAGLLQASQAMVWRKVQPVPPQCHDALLLLSLLAQKHEVVRGAILQSDSAGAPAGGKGQAQGTAFQSHARHGQGWFWCRRWQQQQCLWGW